jgi:Ser/Thr protein kinase RdoA (MazF antagonist)
MLAELAVLRHESRGIWHKKQLWQSPDLSQAWVQTYFWRQADAQSYASVLKDAQTRGVPMQTWLANGRTGLWYWVKSSYLHGEPLGTEHRTPAHMEQLARTLAGLHRMTRPVAGPAFRPSWAGWGEPARHVIAKCQWVVRRTTTDPAVKQLLLLWLRAHTPLLASRQEFSLTHGDIKASNLLWQPEQQQIALIDYEHMRYHWPELELANVLTGIASRAAHGKALLAAYWAHMPAPAQAHWTEHQHTYMVLQLLLRAYRRWVQMTFPVFKRAQTLTQEERQRQMTQYLAKAHALAMKTSHGV